MSNKYCPFLIVYLLPITYYLLLITYYIQMNNTSLTYSTIKHHANLVGS